MYLLSAIFMGFFLVAPLVPDAFALSDEERAELMAESVHCALAPSHAGSPDALESASSCG